MALTTLDRVKNYIGRSEIIENGLSVYCSATDASAATVAINGSTMTLTITGGANAGTVNIDLTDENTDTLSELVSYIDNLDGWNAELLNMGEIDSTSLIGTGEISCLGISNLKRLKVENTYLLTKLIDEASAMIKNEVGRDIEATTYTKELYSGDGSNWLWLNNYPIISVERVSIGRISPISVSFSATNASRASVEITDTKCILRSVVAGSSNTTELTLADYATLEDLEEAIEAVSGWSARVQDNYGSYPSADLIRAGAKSCLDKWISLEMPKEGETDYEVYAEDGRLYNPYGWTKGYNNICVDYRAGYETIPDDIQSACCELVKLMYGISKRDISVKSEKIGSYQYTVADRIGAIFSTTGKEVMSNLIRTKLQPYYRIVVRGI